MIKPTTKRGLLLDFIPDEIYCAKSVNKNRVYKLNNKKIIDGKIIYVMSRELRTEDNWGLCYATELAKENNRELEIFILLNNKLYSKHQMDFLVNGLKKLNLPIIETNEQILNANPGAIILDFNPINRQEDFARQVDFAVFEVDSHNIIPARCISDKQEFSAATMRRKIYRNISEFLTEYPNKAPIKQQEVHEKLMNFIENKLGLYAEEKNDPNKNATSNMSPYLHFGFISAQRIALEVLKSKVSRENKEAFLEELIVRKELSDNFCLYNTNYKNINGAPQWAKETLDTHNYDLRSYIYTKEDFEYAQTHDKLWNTIQKNLLETGKIHGYLRMYWAKKILEWSKSAEEALNTAIYLNDNYALDGNDPNGYVGVLWSIYGVHDRPFQNRLVTGKIRYMSLGGCKKKFDVIKYTG